MVYYVGAATGGIWKTIDGGLNWKPVFDKQPVHSIGALAAAPNEPEVIYAGTGESFIRSNVSIGNGVWKSTDGGENWQHIGLEKTGRISRIVIHPDNPDIVYVSAFQSILCTFQPIFIYIVFVPGDVQWMIFLDTLQIRGGKHFQND